LEIYSHLRSHLCSTDGQILTSLGLASEDEIVATNLNYQDVLNTVQAALTNAEREDAEDAEAGADDLLVLQRSIELVEKHKPSSSVPLTRISSALSRVSCNL
jgi:hypothetical protein